MLATIIVAGAKSPATIIPVYSNLQLAVGILLNQGVGVAVLVGDAVGVGVLVGVGDATVTETVTVLVTLPLV